MVSRVCMFRWLRQIRVYKGYIFVYPLKSLTNLSRFIPEADTWEQPRETLCSFL